jgi:hypothetical protein
MEKTILDMAGFDASSVAVATTAAAQNKPFKMNPDVYKLLKDHEKGVVRPKDEAMEDVKRVAVRHAMKEVRLKVQPYAKCSCACAYTHMRITKTRACCTHM